MYDSDPCPSELAKPAALGGCLVSTFSTDEGPVLLLSFKLQDARPAQSVVCVTLDLGVLTSSPTLGVEITKILKTNSKALTRFTRLLKGSLSLIKKQRKFEGMRGVWW